MGLIHKNAGISGSAPSTATTAAVGGEQDGFSAWQFMSVTATYTGNTGGTLNVYVQRFDASIDAWVDWIAFPQAADGAAAATYVVSPMAAPQDIYTVGTGLTPALAADSFTGGLAGEKLRVIATSGAGTTAGASISVSFVGVA